MNYQNRLNHIARIGTVKYAIRILFSYSSTAAFSLFESYSAESFNLRQAFIVRLRLS